MRLICPECNALYDIPDEMIPPEGREVECSACGHVWMQKPAPAAPAAKAGPEAGPAAGPAPRAPGLRGLSEDLRAAARPEADAPPDLGEAPVLQRPLPEDVLSILREETARELGARHAARGQDGRAPGPRPESAADPLPSHPGKAAPAGLPAGTVADAAKDMPSDPAARPVSDPRPASGGEAAPVPSRLVEAPPAGSSAGSDSAAADAPVPQAVAAAPVPAHLSAAETARPPVPPRRLPRSLPDAEQLAATLRTEDAAPAVGPADPAPPAARTATSRSSTETRPSGPDPATSARLIPSFRARRSAREEAFTPAGVVP